MHRPKISDLHIGSVIERVRHAGGHIYRLPAFPGSLPLEAVRIGGVCYLPSALETGQSVQIVDGAVLPIEAVAYEFTAQFVRDQLLARGIDTISDVEIEIDTDVCILGNVFARNFTHWHEELLKVVALERAGFECTYVIAQLPEFAREMLRLVGVPSTRVLEIAAPVRFSHVLYSTSVSYLNAYDYPGVLLALRSLLLKAADSGRADCGPKLWLDRGTTRLGRRLVNEDEVHRLLDRYEFRRLDIGALPIARQLAAAANTRVMAGVHGSQFVHSQLMPPASHVVECFSPLYLNPTYTEIYRVMRHRYTQITATHTPLFPYQHGGDVLVDCQQLDLALREACDRLLPDRE